MQQYLLPNASIKEAPGRRRKEH